MTSTKWWCNNSLCAHIRQQHRLFVTQTQIFLMCVIVYLHISRKYYPSIASKQWNAIHYFLTAKYRPKISNIINWLLLFVCFNENTQLLLKYQLGCSLTVTFVLRKIMRSLKQRHCSSSFVEQWRWIHKYLYIRVITYNYAMY